jgi:hypothetical protein
MFTALQYGWSIAMLALLAVTQSSLYSLPPYNFTVAGVGNMNLPPFIGSILGALFGGPLVDYMIVVIAKRRGGIYEPETRLWLFLIPGLSMTLGGLMYGLTIAKVSNFLLVREYGNSQTLGNAMDHQCDRRRLYRIRYWRMRRYVSYISPRLLPIGKFFLTTT